MAARLTLSARATMHATGAGGVLTVTDEGVGIAAEELESIFQPFRGSFGKGSGLGLAIVHRIVSRLRRARSTSNRSVGRGTTFRVSFPPVRGRCAAASRRQIGALVDRMSAAGSHPRARRETRRRDVGRDAPRAS